ncbi:MAG: pyruvate, phosphate dikinase [Candidatus Scalindua sp. AMX11]|nr:MAG: pyruvate, phosphate dikinase [Candidatus Scalindua sp.]NOG85954.1 pyruvate, phosphate dikinase [Planctomycetota bacterium]RZV91414.1 MAG: pyruvate, phosphate dikinase [Candidatus Scalindua sp. SCAELEC01]TDE65972.1 MAG: pyruvate, phosphate dikinase [Candidatus Scalindua sp. AMX11]GJQ59280.1 MAG: pyruvate, phosphate dikinase [Candidatus Scalindua sp.]
MKRKYVFFFGDGHADGNASMKELLGGKGANLAEMTNLAIPVPPGFTITTEACNDYYNNNKSFPTGLQSEIDNNLSSLERLMGAKLGDPKNPLLVSVRSGAAASMPGMMDTVLNLGLNPKCVEGLIKKNNSDRFAWDAYRRFVSMFGNVVMGMQHHHFEEILDEYKRKACVKNDTELTTDQLKDICNDFISIYKKQTKTVFPVNPKEQLRKSIIAVFESWNNPRAIKYREIYDIKGLSGTAVNIQAMVFGNRGNDSATGVCFTRNPSTGENKFYGEYLLNAQGEDVVAGIRTPEPIKTLQKRMPLVYRQLVTIKNNLEKHYKDLQDMEFTVQDKKLFMLQTRNGKRTAHAAVKIAVDMVREKLIDKKTAINRVIPDELDQLLHPTFDPKAKKVVIAHGLPASPGAATGKVVFNAEDAEKYAARKEPVILVRIETSPEDIGGMHVSKGILTSRGGMTSHAAVVARGMGTCCVAGCGHLHIDYNKEEFVVDGKTVKKGDYISLDGSLGEVILGKTPTVEPTLSGSFNTLMKWADEYRKLKVRTNADTPEDAKRARSFGAEGIGLCRTEHMFFDESRIDYVRQMILVAGDVDNLKTAVDDLKADLDKIPGKIPAALEGKLKKAIKSKNKADSLYKNALKKLLPMQRGDFEKIFTVMKGLPVTIRLLDPPLHEFLPKENSLLKKIAQKIGITLSSIKEKVENLQEVNPMLGLRGCRLGIVYPDIYKMQVQAIIEAALSTKKKGIKVLPEIMIPLVGTVGEMEILKSDVVEVANTILKKKGSEMNFKVGTMIEIPRAALTADQIAKHAEFFSFGTNDLTQMAFGFSRDDVGSFIPQYTQRGILENDPFQVLDQSGIGQLVQIGIEKGRQTRPNIKIGICGEHGGEPSSIEFCHKNKMDYVSCSPFRVPIARLAAAQAAMKEVK